MDTTVLVVLILVTWCAAALVIGLVLAGAIRRRDAQRPYATVTHVRTDETPSRQTSC